MKLEAVKNSTKKPEFCKTPRTFIPELVQKSYEKQKQQARHSTQRLHMSMQYKKICSFHSVSWNFLNFVLLYFTFYCNIQAILSLEYLYEEQIKEEMMYVYFVLALSLPNKETRFGLSHSEISLLQLNMTAAQDLTKLVTYLLPCIINNISDEENMADESPMIN